MDECNKSFQGLTLDDKSYLCPKCFNPCVINVNWCSSCGELLIGAGFCSGDDYKGCNSSSSEITQCNILVPHNITCVYNHSHINNSPYFSSGVQFSNHGTQPCQSAVSLSPEPSYDATFVNSSLFPASNLKAQNINRDDIFPPNMEPNNTYAAEPPIQACKQYENANHFNKVPYGGAPTISGSMFPHTDRSLEECNIPHVTKFNNSARGVAYSYPRSGESITLENWNGGDFHDFHRYKGVRRLPDGRQRCISGPSREVKFGLNQVCAPNSLQPNYLHSQYGVMNFIANAPSYCNHDGKEINNTQVSLRMNPDNQSVKPILNSNGLPYEIPYTPRSLHRIQSCNFPVVVPESTGPKPYTNGLFVDSVSCQYTKPNDYSRRRFRPGTKSESDHSCSDRNNFNPKNCATVKPHCNWKSSRIAWSVHDPALLKKKPSAYLRASYNQWDTNSVYYHESRTNIASFSQDDFESFASDINGPQSTIISGESNQEMSNFTPTRKKSKRRTTRQKSHKNDNHQNNNCNTSSNGYEKCTKTKHSITTINNNSNKVKQKTRNCLSECESNDLDKSPNPDWLSLPDELWLIIIRSLSPTDRANIALTCWRLSRLAMDRSLWQVIHLHRQHNLTDDTLWRIGNLKPKELRLTYCRGDGLTAAGLKRMFFLCGLGLQKLSLIGCTKGPFDHDLPLRLVADHCPNLKHVNASYTQAVRDQTVIALAKSASHLVSVKLNGAQQISNVAIQQLVNYHEQTLERLELFGCFRLNSHIFTLLGRCQELRALAFGHLHHLSSNGLLELVGKLPHLLSLDLRGTQTLGDDDHLFQLAIKCPQLEEIVLANMNSLKTESGIVRMLRKLPNLRVLDLCGLAAVGDSTMEALATSCPQLEQLDVSCTSVTQKGISHLTEVPAVSLRCIRISHCREINKEILEKLIRACPKLNVLYAYGFMTIHDWSFLREIRSTLTVESGF